MVHRTVRRFFIGWVFGITKLHSRTLLHIALLPYSSSWNFIRRPGKLTSVVKRRITRFSFKFYRFKSGKIFSQQRCPGREFELKETNYRIIKGTKVISLSLPLHQNIIVFAFVIQFIAPAKVIGTPYYFP